MADKTKKWVIQLQIDSSKILAEYESVLKKMSSLERKYSGGSFKGGKFSNTTSGGRGRPQSSGPFSRRGAGLGGGDSLDVDIDNQLSRIRLPVEQAEIFKSHLLDIQKRLNMAQSTRQVKRLRLEFREVTGQIRQMTRAQDLFNKKMSSSGLIANKFTSSLTRAVAGLASVYAVGAVGGAIYRIGKDMDAMRAGLLAASGSAEEASSNFQFLKDNANRLGQDIQDSTRGFNRIAVAAKSAGFNIEESRHIFLAASEAATTFQLDQQRTGLVMLAFSQMMSKGRVSMEELSRQLGENLPITLKAAEIATGKTTEEVIKLIESGKLMSKDFILPFSDAMRGLVREAGALDAATKKLTSQQNRMGNSFKELVDDIFQDQGAQSLGNVFGDIANIIKDMSPLLKNIAGTFFTILDTVVTLVREFYNLLSALGVMDVLSAVFGGLRVLFDGVLYGIYEVLIAIEHVREWFNSITEERGNQIGQKATDVWNPETRRWETPQWLSDRQTLSSSHKSVNIGKVEINANTNDPVSLADQFTNRIIYDIGTGF